jgi:hypothetical protein
LQLHPKHLTRQMGSKVSSMNCHRIGKTMGIGLTQLIME